MKNSLHWYPSSCI